MVGWLVGRLPSWSVVGCLLGKAEGSDVQRFWKQCLDGWVGARAIAAAFVRQQPDTPAAVGDVLQL